MFNLNEKYFTISKRCGRNHQNKFLFTSPQGTIFPWELNSGPFTIADCRPYVSTRNLVKHRSIEIEIEPELGLKVNSPFSSPQTILTIVNRYDHIKTIN